MPFTYRLLALFIFITVMLAVDLRNPPAKRRRFKLYSFILSVGMIGAFFGVGVDSITGAVSPDYFIYGKGLDAGAGLYRNILLLGSKAGFSGALIVGCVLALFNPKKDRVRHLYRYLLLPLVMSIGLGMGFGLVQYYTAWVRLEDVAFWGARQARLFTTVWMVHVGIYVGALISLPLVGQQLRRL